MEPASLPISEETPSAPLRPWWLRRLCSQNPFYLLSSACIVHSISLSLYGGEQDISPPMMLAMVAGYVAFLAAVAYLIVRLWNVWDDARSIFVILLFLFVVLALVADSTVLNRAQDGVEMLAAGLAAAVLVTEFLLRGLNMPLPLRYRAPFYLQLGLVFLYPLWLLGPLRRGDDVQVEWRIFAFSLCAVGTVLTLLPAVRRGRFPIRESGVLWPWPWYPWTVFVFFGICLVIRLYTLCLSFDPVRHLNAVAAYDRLENIFGPYFLAPFLLAGAVLVLEAGVVSGRRGVQRLGLALPLLGALCSVPGRAGNAAYLGFVGHFADAFGSPLRVTLILMLLFYGIAACRRVGGAERWALTCLLALAVIGRNALSWEDVEVSLFRLPDPFLLWLLAGVLLAFAAIRRRSRWWLECSVYAVLAAQGSGWFDGWIFSPGALAVHAQAIAVIAIAALGRDPLAVFLRELSAAFLCCGPLVVCLRAAGGLDPPWVPVPYIGAAALTAAVLGWRLPHRRCLYAAVVNIALLYSTSFLQLYGYLDHTVRWAGLRTFAIGIGLLHVGLVISAAKGGGLRAARLRLVELADRRR